MFRRRMRIRRKRKGPFFAILGLLVLILGLPWMVTFFSSLFAESQAVQAIAQFYEYERKGDFGSAWEMFHPQMQARFNKSEYIQRRSHVYMQDFGVKTFDYVLDTAEKIPLWQMDPKAPQLTRVYKVKVRQTYKGTFGLFTLEQPVYAAQENGKWRILWDYSYLPSK